MSETTTIMCTHSGDEHPWKPESDCPDAIPAGSWSVRTTQSLPVTGSDVPSDEELREALARAMPMHQSWCHGEAHEECCGADDCDCGVTAALYRILALPEMAALIADGERVRRVRDAVRSGDTPLEALAAACRALDGTP